MAAILFGFALISVGALGMARVLAPVENYTYAITWWGILLLADEWNFRRRGLSLWRGRARRFVWVTLPLSALFWLFFELLNLPSPQWAYRGGLSGAAEKVLVAFVSFGTVIPIVVESYWAIAGAFALPARAGQVLNRHAAAFAAAGIALTLLPFFNHWFWFKQGMWLAPALLFLPLVSAPTGTCAGGKFLIRITAAGLVAGFLWELLNWFSLTHWEYLILPSWPHLFRMPWIGYIGFVPFAFTTLMVYAFAKKLKPSVPVGLCLWAIALGGLYFWTVISNERGLWKDAKPEGGFFISRAQWPPCS